MPPASLHQFPVYPFAASLGVATSLLALTGCQPAPQQEAPRQPNVLVLFADDLGYADTGFQRISQDVETPNMDRLAAEGAVFSAGYVTGTVCGPSRAGLMTGRYQQRFGYHDNTAPYSRDADTPLGLDLSVPTFANYLQDAGYRTGMVGKWHDAEPMDYWPHNRGFDEFFGFNNGAATYYVGPMNQAKHDYKPEAAIYRNGELVDNFDQYLTDRFGDEAVDYIDRHKADPFFLYVAFNAIHSPMEPRKTDMDRFAHIEDEDRRKAVAMNFNMDENIGKILDKLEQEGLMEETLIFFLADNGGKPSDNFSLNTPLRGTKGSFWEGGIRVPFTATWRGKIPAQQQIDEPVIALDILATALAAAEVEQQPQWQLEGEDLLPLLTGEQMQLADRYLFWANSRGWAVRDRHWKLYKENANRNREPAQLFHLSEDVEEQHNLATILPHEVARLTEAYRQWDADNDTPRWGWNRNQFPHYNGHHSREERLAVEAVLRDAADEANEERRARARALIDGLVD
ncbi:sulfatase-like hydrolase/transferase [Ferrimonas marina]|uniref:Arylsulfatase A n=1 Tax=Ferrimonas marina TaxID=299255 RepID=A0A1M5P6K6_9GAMM|nr:sulfatase-like hydrolase/transferase [Ferrimonas marina]SHG96853.1 Arylsulfatase A [Ferrimonas marina]